MDFNGFLYNKAFVEEFIELYRENSCLWNVKSKDYLNKNKRDKSYNIVLKKLQEKIPNATLDVLKKKINNMRIAFRRELKKVRASKATATSNEDIYVPTLWYYDLLFFTAQSETGGKERSNNDEENGLESEIDEQDPNCDSMKFLELEIVKEEVTEPEDITLETDLNTEAIFPDNSANNTSESNKSNTFLWPKKLKKRKADNDPLPSEDVDPVHYVRQTHLKEKKDLYDKYGDYIAEELRQLDDFSAAYVQKLFGEILFNAKTGQYKKD